MPSSGDYAIIDVTEGSTSIGKILVLIDDEVAAREIASELVARGCQVIVKPITDRPAPFVVLADESGARTRLTVST